MDERRLLTPCTPGMQLEAGLFGDLAGVFGISGLQQMMAGLQQVMHIGGLILRPHLDPPSPVGGRLPVRPDQPLAGLAGGSPGQFGGGPPMHEKPRLPVFVADGEQAGGLAGGDLPRQARTQPERRHRRPVQLGEVRRQLRPDMGGDARQVKGFIHGDPGGCQDASDLLVGGCPVGDVLGVGVGLPGQEQHRVAVDRFPVHRDPQQQVRRPGNLGQAGQQVIKQHIIGGQRHGLGQGGIQPGAGGQPLAAVGPAEPPVTAAASRSVTSG